MTQAAAIYTRVSSDRQKEIHNCQSDRSLNGVCAEAQLRGAAGMGVSRRRL
jgi:hypothetical protein